MAAIKALEMLNQKCLVNLTTDSQYVKNGITKWVHGWKKKQWKTSTNKPVKNKDLWVKLDEAVAKHQVEWHWVKGHSGHAENDLVDELARKGIEKI